jgi:hypothetical protein
MHATHELEPIVDGLLLTIVVAYLGIAYQFWSRRKGAEGRATRALGQLVVIFVFCAICGYVPRLVELPAPALLIAHAVLATAAWAYLLTGQVDRLVIAVDFADLDSPERQALARAQRREELNAEIEACARVAEQAGSNVTAAAIRRRFYREPGAALAAGPANAVAEASPGQR